MNWKLTTPEPVTPSEDHLLEIGGLKLHVWRSAATKNKYRGYSDYTAYGMVTDETECLEVATTQAIVNARRVLAETLEKFDAAIAAAELSKETTT